MKIGVLTSGGDSPGMNAAIRAVTRIAATGGHQAIGYHEGYRGLIDDSHVELGLGTVAGIIDRGGTILRSSRCPEFLVEENQQRALANCRKQGLNGLIVIGGNGSLRGALALEAEGLPTIGIPATIDNDLAGSDYCIGFDTALNTVIENLSKIRDTASALERVFVVEVMGRSSGAIALRSGLAGGADCVIIPEIAISPDEVCRVIDYGYKRGKTHILVVVAEGAGSAYEIGEEIKACSGHDVKISVLGHIQRGGSPSAFDRVIAGRFGASAVSILLEGRSGVMVGICGDDIVEVPLDDAVNTAPNFDEGIYELVKALAR